MCSGFAGAAHAAAVVTRSKLSMNRFTGVVPSGISLLTNLQALYAFVAAALVRIARLRRRSCACFFWSRDLSFNRFTLTNNVAKFTQLVFL